MLVCDELGAGILERFAARDVIVVVVAVDHIFDRLVGDLLDRIDVLLAALRLAKATGSVAMTPSLVTTNMA
jgi:hypothetical protein